jgi:hypothetical protein
MVAPTAPLYFCKGIVMEYVETNSYHFFYTGPLSQWHPSPFLYKGVEFVTAEQFMMFGKAMVFGDLEIAEKILATTTPKQQKALGRKVKNFDNEVWVGHGYAIVLLGNVLKFTQNPYLCEEFDSTVEADVFVEASPYDTKWGIGIGMNDPLRFDYLSWKGENLLGQVITDIRNFFLGDVADDFFENLDDAREALQAYFPEE